MMINRLFCYFLISIVVGGSSCTRHSEENRAVAKSDGDTISVHISKGIQINCFVYHRFGDSRYPSTNVRIADFRKHLQYLYDNNYNVLTLGEALKLKATDDLKDERRTVVITVDDAYKSFLTGAMPLLKKFDYRATLFVNTKTVGGKDYLSWEDLRKLAEDGVEIGNHTHSHAYFMNYPQKERRSLFKEDVLKAQHKLEKELGRSPQLFAYPFGEFDAVMKHTIKELGFIAAMAQHSGVISSYSDVFALPRFPMGGGYTSIESFSEKAGMNAMPVIKMVPDHADFHGHNPPLITLELDSGKIDLNRMQCFVQGGRKCLLEIKSTQGNPVLKVQANTPLNSRRTLYTITAPGKVDKGWYWFSHLWLQPEISE